MSGQIRSEPGPVRKKASEMLFAHFQPSDSSSLKFQQPRRSQILLLMFLVGLFHSEYVFGSSQDPAEKSSESQSVPAADENDEKAQKAAQLASEVSKKLKEIPDPRTLSRDDLPRVFKIIDQGLALGRQYVSEYPAGNDLPLVCCDLSRMLILNVDRHLGELNEEAKIFGEALTSEQRLSETFTYLSEVVNLANTALSQEISSKLKCRAQTILGDCMLKLRESSRAADAFAGALKLDTSEIDLPELKIKHLEALGIAERFQEMLTFGNEYLTNDPRSPFLPHLIYFTHKAHRHLGALESGRQLWQTWGPVLKAGALGGEIDLPGSEEKWLVPAGKERDFQLMADRAGFYEAFYQLALGNKEASLEAMIAYNDELYERINTGEALSMATKTYLDFQSLPMAQRIDVLHGRPAPSLDGIRWIQPPPETDTDKKLELRIFCDSNRASKRQARFFDVIRKLEHEFSSEGVRVVWLSSVLRAERADREAQSMAQIAIDKKLGWSFGVQPGQEAGILERHLVPHGGTLLMAIDAKGILRWEVIDPMFWDEGLYRVIISRLLKSTS